MDPICRNTAGAPATVITVSRAAAGQSNFSRKVGYALRLMVISLTCLAAVLMALANEQFTDIKIKIKSTQSSAFVYFIIGNVLVCAYSSLIIFPPFKNSTNPVYVLRLAIADLLAVCFLFSSNSAALALNLVALNGNSHYGWYKFCNIAHNFCLHVTVAIVLSSMAAMAGIVVLSLSIVTMHKGSQY